MNGNAYWFHLSNFARLGAFLTDNGIAPADLFRRCELDPASFLNLDSFIPRTMALRAVNEVARLCGDTSASLQLVERQQMTDYGALSRMVLAGPTLAHSIATFQRGVSLIQTGMCIELDIQGRHAVLSARSEGRSSEDPTLLLEAATLWLCRIACLAGQPDRIDVRMPRPRSTNHTVYEQHLGPRLAFSGDRFAVTFDRGLLAQPTPAALPANPEPREWRRSKDPIEKAQAVHDAVVDLLPHRLATVQNVAAEFGVSLRTLQRSLEQMGVSFEDVVDIVRQRRALHLLAESEHSIVEVAYLLGYSAHAHFTRAFRRWTGSTPTAHRRQQHGPNPLLRLEDPISNSAAPLVVSSAHGCDVLVRGM